MDKPKEETKQVEPPKPSRKQRRKLAALKRKQRRGPRT